MVKMFSSGFKPKSNTNKAKGIIRSEIRSHSWNAKSLQDQINHFRTYSHVNGVVNGYTGGKKLVEAGSFACYYSQTDSMLNKIYGKKNVKNWNDDKKWNTYTHLISREVDNIYNTGKMNLKNNKSK